MAIKQLSVFIENKKGALSEVTETLAAANVNIRAVFLADTQDFGILRLITPNYDAAVKALSESKYIVSITEVIGIGLNDKPGGLAHAVDLLTNNGIEISYMYAFATESMKNAYVVIKVADNNAAEKILFDNQVSLLTQTDLDNL